MPTQDTEPTDLDEGIRDAVVLLWRGGFKTVTSCEGGRGHAFQYETIGIELEGSPAAFQQRLVRFLRSHGIGNFTISLVTDYHPNHSEGKRYVHLAGLDILSERKKRQALERSRRRERRALRQLEELGLVARRTSKPVCGRTNK